MEKHFCDLCNYEIDNMFRARLSMKDDSKNFARTREYEFCRLCYHKIMEFRNKQAVVSSEINNNVK
jgi:hypothetical protein